MSGPSKSLKSGKGIIWIEKGLFVNSKDFVGKLAQLVKLSFNNISLL